MREGRKDLCLAEALISGLRREGAEIDEESILAERARIIDNLPPGTTVAEGRQIDLNFVEKTCSPHGLQVAQRSFESLNQVQEAVSQGRIVLAHIVSSGAGREFERHTIHFRRCFTDNRGVKIVLADRGIFLNGDFVETAMGTRERIDGFNATVLSKKR